MPQKHIVALAGGVGAARFLDGLTRVVRPERVLVVGNTADDLEWHGLHISPDLDTVMYTLAGLADPARGWGLAGETFECLDALGRLGHTTWFRVGDRDLATHVERTHRLRLKATLGEVTRDLAKAFGVRTPIVPMSDDRIRTKVRTRYGAIDFQDYFVRFHTRLRISGVCFEGAENARPAPRVLEEIASASAVIVCPSNPIISIGPILAVPGIREALRETNAPVAAVSPIVGGKALKGPAARMMKQLGLRAAAWQVAELYRDFATHFVLDCADARQARRIEKLGMNVLVTNTVMSDTGRRKALAAAVLDALEVVRRWSSPSCP